MSRMVQEVEERSKRKLGAAVTLTSCEREAGLKKNGRGPQMRITDIRETAVPLNSTLANSSIDFSEMTTSVVAVITDVIRDGKPVCGFAFNSTGRYACGAQMRARFIPRVLKADPKIAAQRGRR